MMPAPLRQPPKWAANFPASTTEPSRLQVFPGITPESTATVRRVLEENDRAYDMFEEKRRYAHNHFAHAALARYSLGASAALIQADWEHDRTFLAPLDPHDDGRAEQLEGLPDKITRENWGFPTTIGKKILYLPFFHEEVQRLGMKSAVEEYIFSDHANVGPPGKGPTMVMALMAGVLHPLIHIGHGLEFNDPILTCLHAVNVATNMSPQGWPCTSLPQSSGRSKPLIVLYAEYLESDALKPGPYDPDKLLNDRLREALTPPRVAVFHDLVARWDLTDMSDKGVADRMEELAWLGTLLTGATSRPGYDMRIDFFLMHVLTSALFLPSFMAILGPEHRRQLFQSYALTMFQVLQTRGRPHIFPKEVMSYSAHPTGSKLPFVTNGAADLLPTSDKPDGQNPWLEIISNAIAFRESHVPKSIRSLVYFSTLYGSRPKGSVPGAVIDGKEVIPGLSDVDGSLFVRVAGKIMETQGWVKEGAKEADWDRSALGWDGAWGKPKATGRWGEVPT